MHHCIALCAALAMIPGIAYDENDALACRDVPSCMREAEKNPARFSQNLAFTLGRLPAPVLLRGLAWHHDKPAVTARGLRMVQRALTEAKGHTTESATALLTLARAEKDRTLAHEWIASLSQAPVGRVVLGRFLDEAPNDPLVLVAALRYVEQAGAPPAHETRHAPDEIPVSLRNIPHGANPEEAARVKRGTDTVWAAYLRARRWRLPGHPDAPMDLQVSSHALLLHMQFRDEYDDRLGDLIRAEFAAGRTVTDDELDTYAAFVGRHPEFAREFLTWAESPVRSVRLVAAHDLLDMLHDARFQGEERTRVRHVLIAAAKEPLDGDPFYAERGRIYYFLIDFLENLRADEAADIGTLCRPVTWNIAPLQLRLLVMISEVYPAYRPPLVAAVTNGDMDLADVITHLHGQQKFPGLHAELGRWIARLTPAELHDQSVQERLILVQPLVFERPDRDAVILPKSRRRQPARAQDCVEVGSADWVEDTADKDADFRAFRHPLPEPEASARLPDADQPDPIEKIQAPASPAMSAQEETARWHEFVFDLQAMQEMLARRATGR